MPISSAIACLYILLQHDYFMSRIINGTRIITYRTSTLEQHRPYVPRPLREEGREKRKRSIESLTRSRKLSSVFNVDLFVLSNLDLRAASRFTAVVDMMPRRTDRSVDPIREFPLVLEG